MNGMKLGLRGLVVGTVGMAAALLFAGCGPGYEPPNTNGPDRFRCTCLCQNAYGDIIDPDPSVLYCDTLENANSTCRDWCDEELEGGNLICTIKNTELVQTNGCISGMQGQALASGGMPTSTVVTLDPNNSIADMYHFGSTVSPQVDGVVEFTGGCDSGTCPISFSRIEFWPENFSVSDGVQTIAVTNVTVLNVGPIDVTSVDGDFTIPQGQISLLVSGDVGGSHVALAFTPAQDATGLYLPSAGKFGLYASFSLGVDLALDLSLESDLMRRAPVANAGPAQTVFADPLTETAEVTLDGSGCSDLDDDLDKINWYEGTTYLGSGTDLDVEFGVGTHTVTAVAVDATGKFHAADTTVTVTRQ